MRKEVILNLKRIDYVLVSLPDNPVTPWCAAWLPKVSESGLSWGQGHYFCRKADALRYLKQTYKERMR